MRFKTPEEQNAYAIGFGAGKNEATEQHYGKPLEMPDIDKLTLRDIADYSRVNHSHLNVDSTMHVIPGSLQVPPNTVAWDYKKNCDLAVFWVKGGSEGYYVHIEALYNHARDPLMYAKCWDVTSAEKIVRDITRLLYDEWRN